MGRNQVREHCIYFSTVKWRYQEENVNKKDETGDDFTFAKC